MNRVLTALLIVFVLTGFSGCAALEENVADREVSGVNSPSELYERALGAYQAGRYAEAKERFHRYISQYPESLLFKVALYYLGHCYHMVGETREAKIFYSRVVDTYGDDDFWGAQAMKRLQQIKEME